MISIRFPWQKKPSLLSRLGSAVGNGIVMGLQIVVGVGVYVGTVRGLGKIFK